MIREVAGEEWPRDRTMTKFHLDEEPIWDLVRGQSSALLIRLSVEWLEILRSLLERLHQLSHLLLFDDVVL